VRPAAVARNPTNRFFPGLFALFPQAVQQIGEKSLFAVKLPEHRHFDRGQ
jgi:hypothetical protein